MALQAQPQAPSFLSGVFPNGQTPQTAPLPPQILAQRLRDAQEMRKAGADYSPIRSWTQGMARVADSLVGGYEERQAADQYQQGLQQGAQAGAGLLSGLWGGASTPTSSATTPAPAQTSDSGTGSAPSASLAQYGPLFSAAEQKYNLPSGFLMQTAQIENGGNVNTKDSQTGAKGPFQFTSGTAKAYGLTDPYDINASTDAAARLAADNAKYLSAALGRAPTAGELYLAHQQGAQGAAQLLTHPDAPATDVADPHNLAVNGYKPGQTAGQFAGMFTGRFGNTGTAAASPAGAPSASGPYPTVAQNMAQADATAGQPLPTSIPNAGPRAPSNQVASLDQSIVPQQPPVPDTNIPLPPVDPRAGAIFNKGLGAPSPGQQVVASALAGGGNAPSAPPLTPGQQTVANAVGGAGGDATAPPLTAGGQKVAQAVMPQGSAQGGQSGLSPELMQQYTAVMQNPYVSDNEKAMINQAFMSRVMPHKLITAPTNGGTALIDELTGQQRGFIGAPNFQKVTDINGVEHVLNMNDPQQAAMASGMGAGGSSSAMGGGSQLQPGQKTVREMFPGVPRPGAEEAFYTNKYNQGIANGLSDQQARAAADEFDVNYRKEGAQTSSFIGESSEARIAGEGAGQRRSAMLSAADAAPGIMSRISLLKDVLAKTQTGPLAGMLGKAGALASAVGIGPDGLKEMGIDPNQAVDNQIAQKMSNKMVSESIGAGKGIPASNFSVAERQFIEKMYPNIENQAGSNEAVSDVLLAEQQRALDLADGWSQFKQQASGTGKTPSYEAFEDQWRQQHGKDNIFQPVIDKFNAGGYSTIGTQAPGIAPQTNSQVDQPPPIAGAKKALDNNWYVPDPNRPGKYLKVVP